MASLASLNNRNSSAAREMVASGKTLSGEEALGEGIINYAPVNVNDLVKEIYPGTVSVSYESPSVFDLFFSYVSNPQLVAFFLFLGSLAGVYALLTKHMPAGLMAAALLILFAWGVQSIELSALGLAMVLIGIALISIETFHTRLSVFGMVGTLSALIGMITITKEPFYHVGAETCLFILVLTIASVVPSIILANRIGRARLERIHSEAESLVGKKARVIEDLRRNGLVKIDGKIWPAFSLVEEKIETDAVVEVVKKEGRLLSVVREGGPKTKGHGHGGHGGGHGGHDEDESHGSHGDEAHESHDAHEPHSTSVHSDVPKKDRVSHSSNEHDDGSHHTSGGPDKNSHLHDH